MAPNPLLAAAANPGPPPLGTSIAMPGPAPSMGSPVLPSVSLAPPPPPTQTQTDMAEYNRQKNTGSGVSQIHNPLLRGIARAADIAGSVFAPNLAQFIPGTTLHHQLTMGQAAQNVATDQQQEQATTAQQDSQAQVEQRKALTQQEQAKTAALADPHKAVDPSKTVQTDDGVYQLNPDTGKYDVRVGDRVEKPKTPEQAAYEAALGQGMKPMEAFAALNQAKNTKDATFQQQFLDAYKKAHPGVSDTDAISATIRATSTVPKIEVHAGNAPATGIPTGSPGQNSPLVQAIIDGRSPPPNSRSKAGMAIMAQVTAADPTYDASRYNTYQAMQKEMTSGKTGAAINSLNTIQEHIDRAMQNLPNNGSMPWLNAAENATSDFFGGNPTGKFEVDATGIAGEWGKLVAGGVASEGEQQHVQRLLSPNASPQKMRDNLAEVKAMTDGKLAGIQRQIQSAIHPGPGSNNATSLPGGGESPSGHQIQMNGKTYQYKGTGATDDMKNYSEVKK